MRYSYIRKSGFKAIQSYLITFFSVCILMFPIACGEDFLDKPLQGKLTQENFPSTASDAEQATNAVYNTLRITEYNWGLFPVFDIMSDDGHKGSNPTDQRATIGPYDRFQHLPNDGSIANWWKTLYLGIKRANVVIEVVPSIEMTETLKNQYIAEARFLRALFYFDLVRGFGDVPLVTAVNAPLGLQRAPKEEIYTLIEDDLTQAIPNLPLRSELTQLGRVTKGAAQALLSKVHLFQQEWDEAATQALEVINSGEYELEINFEDANNEAGEHGMESVFEIGAVREESLANGGNQYANVQGVRGNPNRGWGFNRPTVDLMDSFDPTDPRLEATVLFLGETIDGITISGDGQTPDSYFNPDNPKNQDGTATNDVEEIECYNQKVWTPGENVPTQWGHNRRVIRYAEVLLIAAEAINENSGDPLPYLNEVRGRVSLPDITETNQAALRDLILLERRHELAMEGHRFWDLTRHIGRTPTALAILEDLGFIQGKHELLAIPQSEIDLAGIEQNPNW